MEPRQPSHRGVVDVDMGSVDRDQAHPPPPPPLAVSAQPLGRSDAGALDLISPLPSHDVAMSEPDEQACGVSTSARSPRPSPARSPTQAARRSSTLSTHQFLRRRELGLVSAHQMSADPSTPSRKAALEAQGLYSSGPNALMPGGPPKTTRDRLDEWAEWTSIDQLNRGQYLTLDRNSTMVRSTISIAFAPNGKVFASTHGDHSVKIFAYPSGRQTASLEGHPRTPWTVSFHPTNSNLLASGCLGNECRVWNVVTGECIRRTSFHASISCVSFHPSGEFIAVTSGKSLMIWEYERDVDDNNSKRFQKCVLEGGSPFHMVAFHPSGSLIMAGEKNKHPQIYETQFTLKLTIRRFDPVLKAMREIFLEVPRAVAYNDAGIHFSPCGLMLAACVPVREEDGNFHIAVLSLVQGNPSVPVGTIVFRGPIDAGRVMGLTNLKFSATSRHLLAGFSFRRSNQVLRYLAESYATSAERDGRGPQVRVVDVYRVGGDFDIVKSLMAEVKIDGAEDEINVAAFSPGFGHSDGIVYGTQKGRIRLFYNYLKEVPSSQHPSGTKRGPRIVEFER